MWGTILVSTRVGLEEPPPREEGLCVCVCVEGGLTTL